jgi:hypothetical protein
MLRSRGGLATLSILCHEIPHELGDFAILVKHGFSKRQAIMAQFGTALAAMIGTGAGLSLQGYAGGDRLVLVTAGGFLYLAAVTILPDLLDDHGGGHGGGGGGGGRLRTLRFRSGQLLCFAVGIGFMYAVSMLEGMDQGGHHGHSHGHHEHREALVVMTDHHDHHHHDEMTDHHDHREMMDHHEHHDHHHHDEMMDHQDHHDHHHHDEMMDHHEHRDHHHHHDEMMDHHEHHDHQQNHDHQQKHDHHDHGHSEL